MSTRTGVGITEFLSYGGTSGTAAQMNLALDIAWDWAEHELNTNIIISLEEQEIHLWPSERADWNRVNDRVQTEKTHVTSVTAVHILEDNDYCSCTQTVLSGCALVINGPAGTLALRQCNSAAAQACSTCSGRGRDVQARLSYYAGLFATAAIDETIILAVVMRAREIMHQISSGNLSSLGPVNVTSWHSMDYSESRAGPEKGELSFIDSYIKENLLKKFIIKRAFSLRRTH